MNATLLRGWQYFKPDQGWICQGIVRVDNEKYTLKYYRTSKSFKVFKSRFAGVNDAGRPLYDDTQIMLEAQLHDQLKEFFVKGFVARSKADTKRRSRSAGR